MSQNTPAIGIDLGTTYCCIGYLTPKNSVDIIDNEHGLRTTPSYVAFTDQDEIIGKLAKESVYRNPKNVVYDAKRLIGRKFSDKYVQNNLKHWTFDVASDEENTPLIQIFRQGKVTSYKPHEVSAKVLKSLKQIAQKRLGREVQDVVITVPAHFNYHQRTATKEAGTLAGFNVLKIINEPTAAALAYVHKNEINDCRYLLIFDFGGGTLDVSVVTVQNKSITVKATYGNTHLGGRDFDNNLTSFIIKEIEDKYNVSVADRKTTKQRIRARSENLKCKLSFQEVVLFDLPFFLDGEDLEFELSRSNFEKINENLFKECIQIVENCLKDASVDKRKIERVLLIGGSTKMPKVQEMLRNFFNHTTEVMNTINPGEAVAYGAAIQAAMFNKGDKLEINSQINDVAPLSLGVKVFGGKMKVIIPRNAKIPTVEVTSVVTTVTNQKWLRINIYEGERVFVSDNTKIGTCCVDIPTKPVGYPVSLRFCVDFNGILEIEAKTGEGVYNKLIIEYEPHTVQDVNDLLQDALENKNKDKKEANIVETWCNLKNYSQKIISISVYRAEELSDADRNAILTIAKSISDWLSEYKTSNNYMEEEILLEKRNEIENICEPIMVKYGYNIKDMPLLEFHEFITNTSN